MAHAGGGGAGGGESRLSPACMQVLHAICDTLIPSLPYTQLGEKAEKARYPHDVSNMEKHHQIAEFFELPGSFDGLPEEVAQKMERFLRPADNAAVRLLLWLLSTRFGTLLLARKLSLTRAAFPFAVAFPSLPLANREKLLRAWSLGSSSSLKLLFQVFKGFILREFYTKVHKDGRNPVVWNAIDYAGPDPRLAYVAADTCDDDLERKLIHMSKDAYMALVKLNKTGMLSRRVAKLDTERTINADAVIIGSGSGGSVVASQLAEAGYKVVILEKGEYFRRTDLRLLEGPSADMYEGGAFLSTTDGGVLIFAGSTLGGGSAINWSASLKTPPHVLSEWSQKHGLELFASSSYIDAMEKVCERLQVQEHIDEEGLANSVLRKGCLALGMDVGNVPRNAPCDHFCGWCGMGCKSGKKQSVNRAWLVDATRKGAIILTGCEARKIILKKQGKSRKPMRATGVIAEACNGSKKIVVRVNAKVVVTACGALWTPLLLRRSGLRNHHIGRNLHLHPVMMTWGYIEEPDVGSSYEGGIMTAFSREAANWNSSGYGALVMVPSLHPGSFAAIMPWISGKSSKESMLGFTNTVHFIALTRDSGSGRVSKDDSGHLRIEYKLSKTDRSHCLVAACNALRILIAGGATKVGTHNAEGKVFECAKKSCVDADLEEFLEDVRVNCLRKLNTPLASAHQMGSCRMGTSSSTSAVDQNGETWEAEGLFVADSSVFPSASGVNPMVTVQSIALCTSKSILRFLQDLK